MPNTTHSSHSTHSLPTFLTSRLINESQGTSRDVQLDSCLQCTTNPRSLCSRAVWGHLTSVLASSHSVLGGQSKRDRICFYHDLADLDFLCGFISQRVVLYGVLELNVMIKTIFSDSALIGPFQLICFVVFSATSGFSDVDVLYFVSPFQNHDIIVF